MIISQYHTILTHPSFPKGQKELSDNTQNLTDSLFL